MRKTFVMLLAVMIGTTLYAQTPSKSMSDAEKFSEQAGTLIQREFIEVGSLKKATLKVVKYTDLISGTSISSLRFEMVVASAYSKDTKMAALDQDEIDGLVKSIKTMKEKVFPLNPENYTEVTYKSRSDFEAGCFRSKGDWSTYLKLERYDSDSYVFLKKDDFPALLALLEKAKGMM